MFSDSPENPNHTASCFQTNLKASSKADGQFITSSFLYLSQIPKPEKSDDANAIVLSIQNVLKRCKDTKKNGINGDAMIILISIRAIRKNILSLFY